MEYSFEKLEVWQKSKELTKEIYKLTMEFPSEEKFGLINQIRRSAISVPSNIAEGSGRMYPKEQMKFYNMAYGSLMETYSHLIISSELGMIDSEVMNHLKPKIFTLSKQISSLVNAIRKKTKP